MPNVAVAMAGGEGNTGAVAMAGGEGETGATGASKACGSSSASSWLAAGSQGDVVTQDEVAERPWWEKHLDGRKIVGRTPLGQPTPKPTPKPTEPTQEPTPEPTEPAQEPTPEPTPKPTPYLTTEPPTDGPAILHVRSQCGDIRTKQNLRVPWLRYSADTTLQLGLVPCD